MSEEILVPDLGESITEATVLKWLKQKGETVNVDEAIVELETDKVNLEVPTPISGVLSEINSKNGDTVEVGAVLGLISQGKTKVEKTEEVKKIKKIESKKRSEEKSNIINLEIDKKLEPKVEEPLVLMDEAPLVLTDEVEKTENNKQPVILSPAVRKIVAEKNINIDQVKGTGKDERILKGDLISLMGTNPKPNQRKNQYCEEERIKMTRLRQTIARRLKEAQENAAMLTTFNEVDMLGIISMRKENQHDFQSRYGIKLGFMSFFVKACIVGLKLFPAINAEIENEDIIYKNYYNISFAVGTDKGLVVPVLKNADEMSFADIEKEIKRLSDKA